MATLLLIDDEESLLRSLRGYLEDLDHNVHTAINGADGLRFLQEHSISIDAVFVDLNMPVMSGYAFIEEALKTNPDLPIIVMSGVGVVQDALRAVRLGAWDFLTKPLPNFALLQHTLNNVLEKARLRDENRKYQESLKELVLKRTAQLEKTRRQIMHRLSRTAEYKDSDTGRHVFHVGETSALLAKELGLSEEACRNIRDCAPLHDIGKIAIPDSILLKPGPLNAEEWAIMQKHSIFGCEILGPLESKTEARQSCELWRTAFSDENELLGLARSIALLHHERWDGKGYPFGLDSEDIPLEARIVSLVDTYDALISRRPYKNPFSPEQTLAIIREYRGTRFDPDVVDAFLSCFATIQNTRDQFPDK